MNLRMLRRAGTWLSVCVVLLALLSGRTALAQGHGAASGSQQAQIEHLKAAADDAMDNLRYAEALDGYQKAYALSHDPRFLYNMGRTLGALGRYPEAVDRLERFRIDAPAELRAKIPQLEQIIADFKKHVATLSVRSNVQGARVLVRDKAVGSTPVAELKLNAGHAVVEVSADDYETQKKEVDLPDGGALDLSFDLVKAANLGILVVHSTPPATSALVDGKGMGGTPLEASLTPGAHQLVLSRDGYHDLATSAVVERGRRKELDLTLEKTPSIVTRWWFWTIVAVAVASGVVITYAALTERAPDSGDIPPGQVRAPLQF
jgi:hypothetical protein